MGGGKVTACKVHVSSFNAVGTESLLLESYDAKMGVKEAFDRRDCR